jgi:hypothetical protein
MTYKEFRKLKFGSHVYYVTSEPLLYIGIDWTGDCIAVREGAFTGFKGHYAALKMGWPSKIEIAKGKKYVRSFLKSLK